MLESLDFVCLKTWQLLPQVDLYVRTISDSTFYSSGNKDTQSASFSSLHIILWVTPDVFPSRLHGFVFIRCIGHSPLTYLSKLSKCHDENSCYAFICRKLFITSYHVMTWWVELKLLILMLYHSWGVKSWLYMLWKMHIEQILFECYAEHVHIEQSKPHLDIFCSRFVLSTYVSIFRALLSYQQVCVPVQPFIFVFLKVIDW
jgi:hypothetical protein